MHPIEGFIFETASLIPCFFAHHPILILVIKVDLGFRSIIAHDGFMIPGAGQAWDHYIHHVKFECNYGNSNAPFDWLFGTFDDGKEYYEML